MTEEILELWKLIIIEFVIRHIFSLEMVLSLCMSVGSVTKSEAGSREPKKAGSDQVLSAVQRGLKTASKAVENSR